MKNQGTNLRTTITRIDIAKIPLDSHFITNINAGCEFACQGLGKRIVVLNEETAADSDQAVNAVQTAKSIVGVDFQIFTDSDKVVEPVEGHQGVVVVNRGSATT